jgi:uncharacterized protein YfaP (DUF2135 family)
VSAFAVATGTSAAVSPTTALATTIRVVGSGDIQGGGSWDARNDVDLNVTDPAGATVSYATDSVASGGKLDLDSNAGCSIDNINQENITWPTTRAPRGTYIVRINLWDNCGAAPLGANYTVTVKVRGQETRTFTGRLTTVISSAGVGTEVYRFTY